MLTREELADALKAATDADAERFGTAANVFRARLRSLGCVRLTDDAIRRAFEAGLAEYRLCLWHDDRIQSCRYAMEAFLDSLRGEEGGADA